MIALRWRNTVTVGVTALTGLAILPGLADAGTTGYHHGASGYYGSLPGSSSEHGGPDHTKGIGASIAGLVDGQLRIDGTAPDWATAKSRVGDVADREIRTVQIGLGLRDSKGAQRLASAVSTPGNREYGRFLSSSEFTERFGPTRATVDKLTRWLTSQGLRVRQVSGNRQLITATAPVSALERAFDVTLSTYRARQARGTRVTVAPDRDIAVPARLRDAVTSVIGLSDSMSIVPLHRAAPRQQPGVGTQCATFWGEQNNVTVPQKYPLGRQSNYVCGYGFRQVRGAYQLGNGHTGRDQRVGIVGVYNLKTIESDTSRAAGYYGAPPLRSGQYQGVLPSRFEGQRQCGEESWNVEQAIDVQGVHTTAPDAKITYYAAKSCSDPHVFGTLNKAVEANKVSIISNSWGAPDESEIPAATHRQVGQIAVQAAAQGQALLFSSGDAGDNSGATGKRQLTFPAASPWVTAAGGTTVAIGPNATQRFVTGWESAGNTLRGGRWAAQKDKDGPFAGGAGGGRSSYYAEPRYQRGVVPADIARGKRAVPDVAALADGYTGFGIGMTTRDQGWAAMSSGGTSVAAPLLAGMVADAQQIKGKRLGFLNPALYKLARTKVITDVTPVKSGIWTDQMTGYGGVTVPGGRGNYLVDSDTKPQSLRSARGWDPVTGIGTPTRGFIDRLGK